MKIRSIEALRGLAALSVAAAHCDAMIAESTLLPFRHPWHAVALPGTAGVEFFFVLSGFVMAVAHRAEIGRGGDMGRFLWKRACRIYPLYWAVLAIPLYRFWGAPLLTPGAIVSWMSLLPIRTDNLVVVAWTLRQEVTFYLLLSLALLPRIGWLVLAAWISGTVLVWTVMPLPPMPPLPTVVLSHVFSLFNFEFFAGLLAGALAPRWPGRRSVAAALLAAGIAIVVVRMAQDSWGAIYGPVYARPIYGLGYGAVLLALAGSERLGMLGFNRPAAMAAAVAGALSYPLYLSHLFTLDALVGWIGPSGIAATLGPDLTVAVLLSLALLVAAAFALLVDRPVQRAIRPRRRLNAGSTPTPSATG